jgi:hypothetical protein
MFLSDAVKSLGITVVVESDETGSNDGEIYVGSIMEG